MVFLKDRKPGRSKTGNLEKKPGNKTLFVASSLDIWLYWPLKPADDGNPPLRLRVWQEGACGNPSGVF
jgi:hypothetical protein